jgi:hypothetical protein
VCKQFSDIFALHRGSAGSRGVPRLTRHMKAYLNAMERVDSWLSGDIVLPLLLMGICWHDLVVM